MRHAIFRDVWTFGLISNFGGMAQAVGASWLMSAIGTPTMVALVQASTVLPFMLFSLIAGAVADRFDRRVVMVWAQSFMLIVSLSLAAIGAMDLMKPGLLLAFTFLISIGTVFYSPAWQASMGEMVPGNELPGAILLNSMGFNLARAFGPALGGVIVAVGGPTVAFTANAGSYIGLIVVLARWRPAPQPKTAHEKLGAAIVTGLHYVASSSGICVVLLRGGAFGIAGAAVSALMPLIARDLVAGGAMDFGLLLCAFGTGAVGGALLNVRLRAIVSAEAIVSGSTLIYGAATIVLALGLPLPGAMVFLIVLGGSWVLLLSTFNVTIQMLSPRGLVARAIATYQMVTFGGMAAGSWVWGLVAARNGVAAALLASGVATLFSATLGVRWRMPQPPTQPQAMSLAPDRDPLG